MSLYNKLFVGFHPTYKLHCILVNIILTRIQYLYNINNMYKIFSIIISIIAFLLLLLELFILYDEIGSISFFNVIFFIILNIIPTIILFIIGLIAKKYNWNKTINICTNVIFLILSILYFLFISLGMLVATLFLDTTPREPKVENYQTELNKIKSKYSIPVFAHFPETLPENIEDYYFFIENSFDGYDTHYLKFKTSTQYINNELKNKCNNKLTSKEYIKSINYTTYYTATLQDAEQYCILHKRTNKEHYTTGLATNKEHNIIYYFYANY